MQSLIFFGSDQYSAVALNAIILSGVSRKATQNISVVTDQKMDGSEVEKLAKVHNLKVSYYPTNADEMIKFIHTLKDLCIRASYLGLCASFDHLIPANIIELFAGNLYNLHPSLLPQYRNVSPVQYAIAMGDKVTGITLFRISTGIDNGEIIAQAEEPILPTDTTPTLTPRLFEKGAELFLTHLTNPTQSPAHHSEARKSEGWIFTHRLTRDSGHIEWPVLSKLLANKSISVGESENKLLNLRLTYNPVDNILSDLLKALTPWPGIWSNVPTKKGDLRISLVSPLTSPFSLLTLKVLIAGKPKPISYADFTKYYL
jgi:methionyl-tRNA formyltransferase